MTPAAPDRLAALTLGQLRLEARTLGLAGFSRWSRARLDAAVREQLTRRAARELRNAATGHQSKEERT